jgi:hypothetical protein
MNLKDDLPGWYSCSCGYRKVINPVITLDMHLMGREKTYASELSQEIINNINELLDKVNGLLFDLGVQKGEVSSGWRPAAINAQTANAAKRSLHMIGKAVDIHDDANQTLGKAILCRPELLKNYGLWMEDLASTKGQNTNWVHLDIGSRTDRALRVFKP